MFILVDDSGIYSGTYIRGRRGSTTPINFFELHIALMAAY
jgi:hypothetical protein